MQNLHVCKSWETCTNLGPSAHLILHIRKSGHVNRNQISHKWELWDVGLPNATFIDSSNKNKALVQFRLLCGHLVGKAAQSVDHMYSMNFDYVYFLFPVWLLLVL